MTNLSKIPIYYSSILIILTASFVEAKPFESTYEPLPSENILISNANIYDGEGNEFLSTDLLIQDRKIVAIGDSLDHDILGANNFNIDSVLISTGIHKDLFDNGPEIALIEIKNSKKWNFSPTYICENFSI